MSRHALGLITLAALAGSAAVVSPALAQVDAKGKAATPTTAKPADPIKEAATYLDDFVHYVRIDRFDLAKAYGDALLKMLPKPYGTAEGEGKIKGSDLLKILSDPAKLTGFEQAARNGLKNPELEAISGGLLKAYETSKLDVARKPEEIERNIGLLSGTQRQRLFGRDRLVFAGEYAMPQVLAAYLKRTDPTLTAELRTVMQNLGRQAVVPLVTALPALDPASQEQVADVLGDVKNPTARPFLYDLHKSSASEAVRTACQRAITKIDGTFDPALNASSLYNNLAEGYYAESLSLTSFPTEDSQIVWAYDPSIGLVMTTIGTPVFHEAMAMRAAERALALDNTNAAAMSLWLASNFSREIDTPKDYANPAYGTDRKSAMFYSVAAGPVASRRVLARALDTRDVPLARRSIAAIATTAGPGTLSETDGRNALLEALRYPNRRVQYEAALALGTSQPAKAFDGSERVVPILGSAIRDAGAKFALVISQNAEEAKPLESVARGLGYTILPSASSLSGAEAGLSDAPGVDLIISRLGGNATEALISDVRTNSRLGAAPIMAVVDSETAAAMAGKYGRDETVKLVRTATNATQQAEAVKQLIETAAGGSVTSDEALAYQSKSLSVLRDLAISGSTVLNVSDATGPLVTALNDPKTPVRMEIAEVLSHMNDKRAQTALIDTALAAKDDDMIALVGKATASAKRFGNLLDEKQVDRLRKAAYAAANKTGEDRGATALAGLLGAMRLPNEKLIPLVLGTK